MDQKQDIKNFISNVVDKNYAAANKNLQSVVNAKLKERVAKAKKKNNVVTKPITFSLPIEASENINQVAAARVAEKLPEIDQATRAFDRNNSATTLSMMTLTMLNGHSPHRMLRQITAEVEKRKMALAEAQVSHAEKRVEILDLEE